jgi:D-xylose 1-dehydrogenase (NADP+, D-xylono-1,5-lactone-forming)
MPKTVRFGLVGAGRIAAQSIAPALKASAKATFQAAASRSAERAAALGPLTAYASYSELIRDPEVEAVYIATHNGLHRELALQALRSGKHVLCEKPLACSAAECEELLVASEQTGLLLMEAFMYRYHPQISRACDLVKRGAIGNLRAVEASFRFPLNNPSDVRLRREFGGGALLDVGCYCVNLARLFLGDKPARVSALSRFDSAHQVDLSTQGVLDFGADGVAMFSCGFDGGVHQRAALIGTRGVIRLDAPFITWTASPRMSVQVDGEEVVMQQDEVDTFQLEIEDFADAILTDSTPRLSADEGLRNARILDWIKEASRRSE